MTDGLVGVVIAAGLGSRLLPLTAEMPKCMLPVRDKPMLHWALETFRHVGIERSVVIGGYKADRLEIPDGATLVMNHAFAHNNVLHSFAQGRAKINGSKAALVSYSDIIFTRSVVERLLRSEGRDISVVVDRGWAPGYEGRLHHPLDEAEGARFDDRGLLREVGKGLLASDSPPHEWGEFIGMMKMSHRGLEQFWTAFDDVNAKTGEDEPFQGAQAWRKAYLTDMLQELVDRGVEVHCTIIDSGWFEIDTQEDYELAQGFRFE